jgi:hypothetical protein
LEGFFKKPQRAVSIVLGEAPFEQGASQNENNEEGRNANEDAFPPADDEWGRTRGFLRTLRSQLQGTPFLKSLRRSAFSFRGRRKKDASFS